MHTVPAITASGAHFLRGFAPCAPAVPARAATASAIANPVAIRLIRYRFYPALCGRSLRPAPPSYVCRLIRQVHPGRQELRGTARGHVAAAYRPSGHPAVVIRTCCVCGDSLFGQARPFPTTRIAHAKERLVERGAPESEVRLIQFPSIQCLTRAPGQRRFQSFMISPAKPPWSLRPRKVSTSSAWCVAQ